MFDSFAGTIGLVMVALMEMISVIFVYGHEKYAIIVILDGPFWFKGTFRV